MSYALGNAGLMLGLAMAGPLVMALALKDAGRRRWEWFAAVALIMSIASVALIVASVVLEGDA